MNSQSELPVNLSETDNELILHAAMPGVEPEDISVILDRGSITLKSTPRGMQHNGGTRHMHEWEIGRHERTLALPKEVVSEKVNATYKNGVLTVAMPQGASTKPREIRLTKIKSAHGGRVGHRGHV
jgi:HSP20 family protein